MRIIDPKQKGDTINISAIEARLNKYNLKINKNISVTKIEWQDKPLLKTTLNLQEFL